MYVCCDDTEFYSVVVSAICKCVGYGYKSYTVAVSLWSVYYDYRSSTVVVVSIWNGAYDYLSFAVTIHWAPSLDYLKML